MTPSPSARRAIAFTAHGPSDPSTRVRLFDWQEHGDAELEICVGWRGSWPFLAGGSNDANVVVLRSAARASDGTLERRLLGRAAFGIYEIDDGLPWDDGRLDGLGAWWKVPFRRDRLAERAASSADRVVAGNAVLANWARERCDDVIVIPSCVAPERYRQKVDYAIGESPTLVWVGSAATEFELDLIAPALRELHRYCGARLLVIGAPTPARPSVADFADKVVWSPTVVSTMLARADVGIMPLHDGVYQRAKCGYKVLQYGAARLPSVSSPVGVNRNLADAGLTTSADSPDEWFERLRDLLEASSTTRAALGEQAYVGVQSAYSFDANRTRWRSALFDRPGG